MTSDYRSHNQSQNNGILHNAQDRFSEVLPPTQILTEEQQPQMKGQKRRWKRCHGNRKLQHFKRKCRARGLTEEQITTRIQNRNDTMSEQPLTSQAIPERTQDESGKRKRDDQSIENSIDTSIRSLSQLSISQETQILKKIKCSPIETVCSSNEISTQSNSPNYVLYKPSKYLKMPRRLLLHSLYLQLNCSLKKKKEQRFILSRLKTIDQQFCLEQIRYLYQTYFDLGLQEQVWLVSLTT
jgi:hypothetical protein